MRQDQFESLQQRAEELLDLFLDESDPAGWPGHGLKPSAMDKQTRGDRYWCKKDAVATLACAQRIGMLVDVARRATAGDKNTPEAVTPGADDLEKEVRDAEAEAERILNRVGRTAAKAEFDKRVHGKP